MSPNFFLYYLKALQRTPLLFGPKISIETKNIQDNYNLRNADA